MTVVPLENGRRIDPELWQLRSGPRLLHAVPLARRWALRNTSEATAVAAKAEDKSAKRRNWTVPLGEALGSILDPALKKRGFATRDIIAQWKTIAPPPYGTVSTPDRLTWPRGAQRAEGAILTLRCQPGHALALAHESGKIAAAINRYFGYLLVKDVRLSAEPLIDLKEPAVAVTRAEPSPEVLASVSAVEDKGLREALLDLGRSMESARKHRR